jgi:hypothetical protein
MQDIDHYPASCILNPVSFFYSPCLCVSVVIFHFILDNAFHSPKVSPFELIEFEGSISPRLKSILDLIIEKGSITRSDYRICKP